MGVSKTGFIYGLVIFYAVVLIFTGLLGNTTLKYQDDIPTPYIENMLDDKSISQTTRDEAQDKYFAYACVTPNALDFSDGFQLSDLVPAWLKPKCVSSVAIKGVDEVEEDINQKYLDGLTDPDRKGSFGFIPSIITGFELIPSWLNLIIFTPLTIAILFVLVTTIGGIIFDGGD